MNFYRTWAGMLENEIDDAPAVGMFLDSFPQTIAPFHTGSEEELQQIVEFLSSVPLEHFLTFMQKQNFEKKLETNEFPCFGNFENGASRLNELLEFSPEGLTYEEAGSQLIEADKEGACVKYGETHAKLARMMNLVYISVNRPAVVTPTPWGSYLTSFEMHEKKNILKALLLRDPCIRLIISQALKGQASYRAAAAALSDSTARRRRTNVKWLIEYILTGSAFESTLLQIDWDV